MNAQQGKAVEKKMAREVQLGFSFLAEMEPASSASVPTDPASTYAVQPMARPRGLAEALATARAALLDAGINEVEAELLPVLEFCEALLTRALDVAPLRAGTLFSGEETRSLRGIGHAQWLLTEEQSKREAKASVAQTRKLHQRTG
jgi:hypothetical protein